MNNLFTAPVLKIFKAKRKYSNEVVGYDRPEMPTHGIDWAKCLVSISNITALLTGLTAYVVGRYDLIRAPGAFRMLSVCSDTLIKSPPQNSIVLLKMSLIQVDGCS
jgi:hypothetical protein